MPDVTLRPIDDSDLDGLFEQMRDPESVQMAAFTTTDPHDRATFDSRMARFRAASDITMRAVVRDERLVGSIAILEALPIRPMHARAASDNLGSLKVLQRAGFKVVGTETAYANARNGEIEETIFRFD